MARVNVDRTNECFGSDVTVADLALFNFTNRSSHDMTVYEARDILMEGWKHEIESIEMEYPNWTSCTFKDGSVLTVSAWQLDPTVESELTDERSRLDAI